MPTSTLHCARQDGEIIYLSPEPLGQAYLEARPGVTVTQETMTVPLVSSRVVMWESQDGELFPHLHFSCPRCQREHNVDLHPDDSNPRFGCCDSCGWDSPVWIEWHTEKRPPPLRASAFSDISAGT